MTATQADEDHGHVIVIDDDGDLLAAQTQGLKLAGFSVMSCANAPDALRRLSVDFDGVVLSDVRMPQMDGLAFLEEARAVDAEIPVLLLTGHGDVSMAVGALKNGAYDFLTKPFPMDKLVASLRQAVKKRRLVLENRQLRSLHADSLGGRHVLLGDSAVMVRLRDTLAQIADAEIDVLITGDTGTGKETAARALHRMSSRRNKPFVHLNCATLTGESFHSDLFGTEIGARAAHLPARRTMGRVERANKGFVLFDEVDALSLLQQANLLDMVETRSIRALGSEEPRPLDLRILATSKRDLRAAVAAGSFRADLFYRLSGVSIHIPPLAQRRGDIPMLFQQFVVRSAASFGRPIPRLTEQVQAFLQMHDWQGNVRELEHFAERFALGLNVAGGLTDGPGEPNEQTLAERMAQFEAHVIRQTLEAHHGRAGACAQALGLARKTFYDKLARHQIAVSSFRDKGEHGV